MTTSKKSKSPSKPRKKREAVDVIPPACPKCSGGIKKLAGAKKTIVDHSRGVEVKWFYAECKECSQAVMLREYRKVRPDSGNS